MNCPSCGAPLQLQSDLDYCQCDYCKGYYFPDQNEEGVRVFGEEASLNCPVCAVPLLHATMGGTRFLYCRHCRGMLISMEIFDGLTIELRAQLGVLPIIPKPPDPRELERRIFCPQCGGGMVTHRYGGPGNIVLDSCSKCYLDWLDHGELMRVVHTPDHTWRVKGETA
ncbi:MAG TPA: zf-TFIIB domain-containing protein [Bryobacteraceae bacterium]|jgi:Zn-finger nucleic acid-binding protein